jgi:hypothetical protein
MARNKAVKLSPIPRGKNLSSPYNSVVFFVTPDISESRSVNYAEISDVRLPASILIWMGSPSRNFSLNAKFIARSKAEADVAFRNVNLLKSWCVTNSIIGPEGTITATSQKDYLQEIDPTNPADVPAVNNQDGTGPNAPPANDQKTAYKVNGALFSDTPEVLGLEGFAGQFRKIPVVITSLNINYSSEVDYIANSRGVLVPILQEISISLKEAREITSGPNQSAGAIDTFNLTKFKQGLLDFW